MLGGDPRQLNRPPQYYLVDLVFNVKVDKDPIRGYLIVIKHFFLVNGGVRHQIGPTRLFLRLFVSLVGLY
jgi:hypothetical protein